MTLFAEEILGEALIIKEQADKLTLLGDKLYICMGCGAISSHYKFGGLCANCESGGERQFEQERGN